jgi:hypothetical protein
MNRLDNHNSLYPLQHGFRSKLSCETQLLTFTQEIFDSMASGKQTDVAVMDFSKAFDKVDQVILPPTFRVCVGLIEVCDNLLMLA